MRYMDSRRKDSPVSKKDYLNKYVNANEKKEFKMTKRKTTQILKKN